MKHKFQNPLLKHIVRELIKLDKDVDQMERADAYTEAMACPECQHTAATPSAVPEVRGLQDFASDHGIVLGAHALMQLNQEACKESARQSQQVTTSGTTNLFHPEVLEKVLGPLIKSLSRV